MKIGGNDLLVQIENESPKLGSFLRRYIMPAIQSRGLAGHILATPTDAPGDVQLQPISSLLANSNPKGASYLGTTPGGVLVPAATPASGITQLSGDVLAGPGSGSQAATVVGVNGAAVPPSEGIFGTNASGQIIAAAAPGTVPNFADNESPTGGPTVWNLAHTPNPAASLQLFSWLSGFGAVLLIQGVDYTLAGAVITITASYTIGDLYAFYRF